MGVRWQRHRFSTKAAAMPPHSYIHSRRSNSLAGTGLLK